MTTAVQKGGEKYTVTLNGKAIGNFVGASSVLPEKISMISTSQQGIVGNQVTVRAQVIVGKDESKAGIPVTFNVVSSDKSINKDHVVEVLTNADGIAEYSYTQYASGKDTVTAYATGKANVRTAGVVYWAASAQLTIKDITEATTLVNGSKKVYEINSAQNANGYVFVAFAENVNVTPDKSVKGAKIEGLATHILDANGKITSATNANGYPYAYTTGGTAVTPVKLDKNGKANLVVTGSNATVTPVVYSTGFVDATKTLIGVDAAWSSTLLQDKASTVKFELKHVLGLTLKAEGVQTAAKYKNATETGGRDYTVTYTDKDGKVAAPGTKVLIAIDTKDIKGALHVLNSDGDEVTFTTSAATPDVRYYAVSVEKDGQASFTVSSTNVSDYVAPVAFIDNGKTPGSIDADDLQIQGEITYFIEDVTFAAKLAAKDKDGKPVKAVVANNVDYADFEYILVDQNGKPRSSDQVTTVSFEVTAGTGIVRVGNTVINPGQTKTVNAQIAATGTKASVRVIAQDPSSVTVTATGSQAGVVLPSTNPSSVTVDFSQYGTAAITGNVTAFNTALDTLTVNNVLYNYSAGVYQYKGSVVSKSAFVGYLAQPNAKISITKDANGNFTFNLLDPTVSTPGAVTITSTEVTAANTVDVTFSKDVKSGTTIVPSQFSLDINGNGVVDLNEVATAAVESSGGLQLTFGTAVPATTESLGNLKYTPSPVVSENIQFVDGSILGAFTQPVALAFTNPMSTTVTSTNGSEQVLANSKITVAATSPAVGVLSDATLAVTVTADADFGGTSTPIVVNVPVTSGDTEEVVASKIRAALSAHPVVGTKLVIGGTGKDVSVTSKTTPIATANNVSIALAANATAGTTAPTATTTASTQGVNEVSTLLVVGTVPTHNNVKPLVIRVKQTEANGVVSVDRQVSVSVVKTDTKLTIAQKIATAIQADTVLNGEYTVTVGATDTVILTNKTAKNVTVALSN